MDCSECLYFHEQPGSCHGACKNTYLTREDLVFKSDRAIELWFKADLNPHLLKDCKRFSKRPKCVKCGKLFHGEIGSVMYAHFPDQEFEGICADCHDEEDD